jgi:transketolase
METMRDRFVTTTARLLETNPRLAIVLAVIGVSRFAEEGTLDRHPDRFFNVGIREQLMIGVTAGLALEGLRPIVHSYAPFLVERPFEQLKLDLSHQGVGAVLVSTGASFDAAASGRTHQAPGDVALVGTLPNWEIHVPGHPDEAELFLRHAVREDATEGSVYIRLSDASNADSRPVLPGRIDVVREGSHGAPTLVAVGPTLDPVTAATDDLEITLLYAATVRPLDATTLRQSVTGTDVVLVEPYLVGTSTAAVSEALSDRPHRVMALGVPRQEHRHYGSRREHEAAHQLDASGIRRQILEVLDKRAA